MTKREQWFEKLESIWLRKAPEEVGGLVAPEFSYYEDPFEEPVTNTEQLVEEWQAIKEQEIELLEITPHIASDSEGAASYHFIANIAGEAHESRGAYLVKLDNSGKAVEFRQWWNIKK